MNCCFQGGNGSRGKLDGRWGGGREAGGEGDAGAAVWLGSGWVAGGVSGGVGRGAGVCRMLGDGVQGLRKGTGGFQCVYTCPVYYRLKFTPHN